MNPSTDLFNDGSLAAQWSVVHCSSVVEEGESGEGSALVTAPQGDWGAYQLVGGLRIPVSGDFDVAVVGGFVLGTTGDQYYYGVAFGDSARAYSRNAIVFVPYVRSEPGGGFSYTLHGAFVQNPFRRPVNGAARLRRIGTTITAFVWIPDGVTGVRGVPKWETLATFADQLGGADGYLYVGGHASGTGKIRLLAFYALTDGTWTLPAPANGAAWSSPKHDDSDLGVSARWNAVANVARTVEWDSALDDGFTSGLRRRRLDGIPDGGAIEVRRGGMTLGDPAYFRARFVDELGQAGAWSATVLSTAAGYMQAAVSSGGSAGYSQTSSVYGTLVDEALQDHCLADAGLRRLVGDRIYPEFAPASAAAPYVLRTRISSAPHDHLAGEAAIGSPTYQFTVVARSNRERNAVAEVLRASLSRYSGPMGTEDVEISSPDEADDLESAADGSERRLFVRRLDFEVWHSREPVR